MKGDEDYISTTRDVRRLIGELRGERIDALVIDLRGNGGGHLTEATGLVGPVHRPRSGRAAARHERPHRGAGRSRSPAWPTTARWSCWSTASAPRRRRSSPARSRTISRGLVVGQQTYGKGTVQNLYPLDRYALGPKAGFGQLTVTIGKYYRVTGGSTQHNGVEPDITLPSLLDSDEIGESSRESALPWDRIDAARYTPEPAELPVVPMHLRATTRSASRTTRTIVALQGDVDALAAAAQPARRVARISTSAAPSAMPSTPSASSAKMRAARRGTDAAARTSARWMTPRHRMPSWMKPSRSRRTRCSSRSSRTRPASADSAPDFRFPLLIQ